jgi:hypothetical protein
MGSSILVADQLNLLLRVKPAERGGRSWDKPINRAHHAKALIIDQRKNAPRGWFADDHRHATHGTGSDSRGNETATGEFSHNLGSSLLENHSHIGAKLMFSNPLP